MRLLYFVIAIHLSLISAASIAAQHDPLWLGAREAVRMSRDLVASEVISETVVTDDSGKNLDTIKKTTKLTGWRDNEPVRTTVSMVDTQQSGLGDLKFDWGIANHPEQALADGDSIVRVGPAVLNGKTYVLFHVAGIQKKRPFTSKVWINEATGLPMQADYTVTGIPMTTSMTYSVVFGRDAHDRWLPLKVDINASVSALFYKFQAQSVQQLSNWVKRP